MAIKYVEDYRIASFNDTQTIQAAIDNLVDGDTLIFEQNRCYALDAPVSFTSYDSETRIGTTRSFLVIDGNGCTICGSDTYNELYGKKDENKNALFYISDKMKNGITHSVIKDFIFNWSSPESNYNTKTYPLNTRNMAIAVVTPDYDNAPATPPVYYTNSTIKNCEFNKFGTGIYMCGENVIIELCKFVTCYSGIFSDGTVHLDARLNYFFTTQNYGLRLHISYNSNAYGNYFYKCRNNSIAIGGPESTNTVSKSLGINVYSNKIFGGEIYKEDGITIDRIENQTGILCSGGKDVVIRDNIIKNMTYDTESPSKDDYGIGILLYGNNNTNNVKNSERVIVANNVITGSQRHGIKAGFASSCTICGNSIHSGERGAEADFGIYIKDTAGDLHVSDNALYHFADGKSIRTNKYNVQLNNNTIFDKDKKFDPFDPIRYIDTTVSDSNSSVIRIPDLPVALENNEVFGMLIPEGYGSSIVTNISYDGYSGYVYKNGSDYNFTTSEIGTYVKIKYSYGVSSISGQKTISFTVVEE